MKHRILIIDDEKAICSSLSFAFEDHYEVFSTTVPEKGMEILATHAVDVVLLDWRLGSVDGLQVLKKVIEKFPHTVVIVMTAYGTIQSSVEAIKSGAFYYITKPLNIDQLSILIEKGLEFRRLNTRIRFLQETYGTLNGYAGITGKSKKIKEVFQLIEKVKDIDSNIMITGESGTGKELVARAIHYEGFRNTFPFEVVNCAAIPENLLESELFGYRKGAFTGAVQAKTGKVAAANGGTLFLDEVGEMPLSLQAKILRVVQEREVTPLGANQKIKVDVRIIAATNRNLQEMVKEGKFREDLYFRLNVIPIHLPPLRDRKEDIPLLLEAFLEKCSTGMGQEKKEFSEEALRILMEYEYPGNVRELANIVEYAVALSTGTMINLQDIPPYLTAWKSVDDGAEEKEKLVLSMGKPMREIEKEVILTTLSWCKGHRKKTAAVLGISERSLREKLKQYRFKK